MPLLHISGHVLNRAYQEAKLIADDIVAADDANLQVESKSLLEYQWLLYLAEQKRLLGGKSLEHDSTQPLVVHSTFGYLGGLEELIVWATTNTPGYADPREHPDYAAVEDELQTLADREFAQYVASKPDSSFAYMDFSSPALEASAAGKSLNAGGAPSRPGTSAGSASARPSTQGTARTRRGSTDGSQAGGDFGPHRVIFELFTDSCPVTCENFRLLCSGEKGVAKSEAGKDFALHYLNTAVHRVVRDGWIQGGDIVTGRGCDSHCALGGGSPTFPDENLSFPLLQGSLAMANTGPHTNGSQFVIALRDLPAFAGKYVVFGRVVFGQGTLDLISSLPCRPSQRPDHPLNIVACDVFRATMLDDNVNKWTRKRAAKKKKPLALPARGAAEGLTPRIPVKSATILVVGFEGAGKSSLVNNLLGQPWEPTNPTVGFERKTLSVPSAEQGASAFNVQLYGLGGAENIRGYWTNYVDAVHGVLFVVDASETKAGVWETLAAAFKSLLLNPLVQGKPVVVFANKQDRPGALSMTEVSMRLQADALAATSPHMHFVKCCARTDHAKGAKKHAPAESPMSPAAAALNPSPNGVEEPADVHYGTPSDVDPNITRGLAWLLARIGDIYLPLSERVTRDIAEVKRVAKEQMEISKAKIKREREARELAEAEAEAAKSAAAAAAAH